jgi:uncharacterized membrane protein YphA (DoxX/SURF4 family)
MKSLLTLLRIAIGWHFLYEGCIKWLTTWSSENYLNHSHSFMSGFYQWLAASPLRIEMVDILNIAGLTLIGLSLCFGLLSRWSSASGAFLLLLYYFAYPPFGLSLLLDAHEGSVFVVDKLLVEAVALAFIAACKEQGYGLDAMLGQWKRKRKRGKKAPEAKVPVQEVILHEAGTRRDMLKNLISIPVLAGLGWGACRNNRKYSLDALSGATIQVNQVALKELKGELPRGKLGNHALSRLVMGGNLIGGWAHARDLIYAGPLFKAYNTEKKIFETLMLCEQAGINSINIGFPTMPLMVKYKKVTGSKIKVITQVGLKEKSEDLFEDVSAAVDHGMDIIQLQGNWCDWLVRDGRFETIAKMMEHIRSQGLVAGMGAHTIDSLILCEEKGIVPDYYMKTMHHDNYWSAHPRENRKPFEVDGAQSSDHNQFHDNCFCPFPDRTVEFVNRAKIPVMGFKVLAAGAIHPRDGFRWAFENGADFICVGMFDFQVVDDVNICLEILQNIENRQRAWYS